MLAESGANSPAETSVVCFMCFSDAISSGFAKIGVGGPHALQGGAMPHNGRDGFLEDNARIRLRRACCAFTATLQHVSSPSPDFRLSSALHKRKRHRVRGKHWDRIDLFILENKTRRLCVLGVSCTFLSDLR